MRANQERQRSRGLLAGALVTLLAASATILSGGAAAADQGDGVHIPDSVLRNCISESLNQDPTAEITETQMRQITNLSCFAPGISDLSGLETAKFLSSFFVFGDGTTHIDLTPLKDSVMLQSLTIIGSQIDDLSPLIALPGIKSIDFAKNQVSDLSPISKLYSLERVKLDSNQLVELSDLVGLHRLIELQVADNQIADLTPVSQLPNLESLWIGYNQVSDLSPLAPLGNLRQLAVESNSIAGWDTLKNFDLLESLEASNTGMSDLSVLEGLGNLLNLGLRGNGIEDVAPLAALQNLMTVNLNENRIADVSAFAGFSGYWLSVRDQVIQRSAKAGEPTQNPIIGFDGLTVASNSFWFDEASDSFVFETHGKAQTAWSSPSGDGTADFGGIIEWAVTGTQVMPETPIITQATTNKDGSVNDPVLTSVETVGITYILFGMVAAGETARLYAFPHGGYYIDDSALPEGWAFDPVFSAVYFELVFDEASPYVEPTLPVSLSVPNGSTGLVSTGAARWYTTSMLALALVFASAGFIGLRHSQKRKRSDG